MAEWLGAGLQIVRSRNSQQSISLCLSQLFNSIIDLHTFQGSGGTLVVHNDRGTKTFCYFGGFKEGYTTLQEVGSLYLTLYTLIDTVSSGRNLLPPPHI